MATTDPAFAVHFTNPHPLLRLAPQPVTHWQFFGAGELVFKLNSIVLRGRRPRPLGFTEQALEIPLADIFNVGHVDRIVQFHVRIPLAAEKLMQLWVRDEQEARRIVNLLPKERTPRFERIASEREKFREALAEIGARSVVTPALVAANCLAFAWSVYVGAGILTPHLTALIRAGSNFGPFTLDGQWWRLLSSLFLHFGLLHLLINTWALWQSGRLAERLLGSMQFALLYVFAGLSGNLASLWWAPGVNTAGTSAALFGVLGGLLSFIVRTGTRVPIESSSGLRVSGSVFVLYSLANGLNHAGCEISGLLGGLLGGLASGWLLARPLTTAGRSSYVGQLSLALLGGAITLGALSWPLIHPNAVEAAEWHFRDELQLYSWDEQRAEAEQRALDLQHIEGNITREQWGELVATDILPRWQAAEGRFASVRLPPQSSLAPLEAQIISYLAERRIALTVLSDGARQNDAEKLRQGQVLLARSRARQIELASHLPPAY
ncbi:MAG TPA: rhomboid family intramembrane serine protease [Steroidobacteraceae bacterium]